MGPYIDNLAYSKHSICIRVDMYFLFVKFVFSLADIAQMIDRCLRNVQSMNHHYISYWSASMDETETTFSFGRSDVQTRCYLSANMWQWCIKLWNMWDNTTTWYHSSIKETMCLMFLELVGLYITRNDTSLKCWDYIYLNC